MPGMPTGFPCAAVEEGAAVLRMPDGLEIELPVVTDAAGAKYVDIRRLQPR